MYGCSDAYIIYGFTEGNRERHISEDALDKFEVNMYAIDVVRNCMGEAAYGITCEFDSRTGEVVKPSIDDKIKVHRLFDAYLKHNAVSECNLGYHLIVSGDYEIYHTSYDLE